MALRLRKLELNGTVVGVQVVKQHARGRNFGNRGVFTASNGVTLQSAMCPQNVLSDGTTAPTFYVRGDDPKRDNDVVPINGEQMLMLEKAVREYNGTAGVTTSYEPGFPVLTTSNVE